MFTIITAVTVACWLSLSGAALARGSGAGHGSGGHGGHASGGHGSNGPSGGRSHGRTSIRSTAATRSEGGSGPVTAATDSSGRRPRDAATASTYGPLLSYVGIAVGYSGVGVFCPPFFFGSGYPYLPFGYPFGYGAAPFSDVGSAYPFDSGGPTGAVRLNVKPRTGEVYVDGDYAGVVDDFDGHFQHLDLTAGVHRIEIRALGHHPLVFDVTIEAHHRIEYRGSLTPIP